MLLFEPWVASPIGSDDVVVALTLSPRLGMRRLRWAGPRLLQLACGLGWWIVITAVMAINELQGNAPDLQLILVLVVGGIAQVLVASLAYLAPVLRAGGREQLGSPPPGRGCR